MPRLRALRTKGEKRESEPVQLKSDATCSDCYFRRAGLCALRGEVVCPTFRAHGRGSLTPPQQPRLVPRPLRSLAGQAVG